MKTMRRKKSAVRASAGGRGTSAAAARPKRARVATVQRVDAGDGAESHGYFYSQLSHDLRNPVSVVLMSTQMIGRHFPADHAARRYLDLIQRGAEELEQMLDELSDVARVEDGCLPDVLRLERTDLPALVEEAVAAARPQAEGRQLTVRAHVAPGLGPIACDRDRILRVLSSLVARAVRITPKQGAVAVELGPDGAGGARIAVLDGGPGVAEADRASLFELPKGKVPVHSRRATSQGSVLTLFVARQVVEAHGGSMSVEHPDGGGTRYVLTLPQHEIEPAVG
jgi:signal transduction histidine kinase